MTLNLVAGGSGYFGELLVKQLAQTGAQVRVFDLNRPGDEIAPFCDFVQGDVRDAQAVDRALQGVDRVYHNVAQVPLAKDRSLFWSVNYDGTRQLLDAAHRHRVTKFIYTSSSAVFGVPKSNPVTEQTVPRPAEEYGRAKLAGEKLCADFAAQGLDASIIRPRTILGHARLGIFQILFEWLHGGYNIPLMGSGDNVYQFVHADDLASACIAAAERPGAETFNIGAAQFGTMKESLTALIAHAGTGSKLRPLPASLLELTMNVTSSLGLSPLGPYHALMYGRSMYFDISKAKTLLGWQPRYSNIEMLCESYDWYVRNRQQVLGADAKSAHSSAVKQRILGAVKYFI